jgi:D-alanine transaminase
VPGSTLERCDIKTVMLLPSGLARGRQGRGREEAWFVDPAGQITEGASSNAWIITLRLPRYAARATPSCAA